VDRLGGDARCTAAVARRRKRDERKFLKPMGVIAFPFASVWLAVLAIWLSMQQSAT
jgi:hypothetical protein